MRLARIGLRSTSLALLLASSGGCAASGGDRWEPVDVLRRIPVTCDGAIGTERSRFEAREDADDGGAALAADRLTASVHVGVVPAESVAAWTAWRGGAAALVVARGAADEALRRHAELGREGELAVASGRVAVIANERDISFLERFDLKTASEAAILDPVVGHYSVGDRVEVAPRRDEAGDAWTIDVEARSIDGVRQSLEGSVHVLGAPDPVRVQVPLLARVRTRTTARLERGEALLLVSPALLDHARVLVTVIVPDWPMPTE